MERMVSSVLIFLSVVHTYLTIFVRAEYTTTCTCISLRKQDDIKCGYPYIWKNNMELNFTRIGSRLNASNAKRSRYWPVNFTVCMYFTVFEVLPVLAKTKMDCVLFRRS